MRMRSPGTGLSVETGTRHTFACGSSAAASRDRASNFNEPPAARLVANATRPSITKTWSVPIRSSWLRTGPPFRRAFDSRSHLLYPKFTAGYVKGRPHRRQGDGCSRLRSSSRSKNSAVRPLAHREPSPPVSSPPSSSTTTPPSSPSLYFESTANSPATCCESRPHVHGDFPRSSLPMLDHELAEFAARIPHSWKNAWRPGKSILPMPWARLPPELLVSQKKASALPKPVFRTSLREFLWDHLTSSSFLDRDIVSRRFSPGASRNTTAPCDNSHWLVMLLMLELWFREFGEPQSMRRRLAQSTSTLV